MRLVHLSDLHLGFRAYGKMERGWNQRERDLAAAFRWALQETVRLRPDMVIVTGDVFDHPSPPSTAFLSIHRGVAHLQAHLPGVPVLVIAGERDTPTNPADPGPVAVLDALPGVEAAAGSARAVRFRRTGVHALLVPFRAASGVAHPEVRPDPSSRWNVLLVRGGPGSAAHALKVDPGDWDYVAIGGEHQARAWEPHVRASGALERPRSSPWQEAAEERGFLSFDLDSAVADFHSVPGRPVVDLAPVRVEPGDVEAGTRRLRELLQGVPGGVEGKILRVRLRGDVISPGEGVAQGLLDAVRRRAAHLEVQIQSPDRHREGVVLTPDIWSAKEIVVSGAKPLKVVGRSGVPTITLLTSETEASRIEIIEALRDHRQTLGARGSLVASLRVLPAPPEDPVALCVWAGGRDATLLLRTVLGGMGADPPRTDTPRAPLQDPGTEPVPHPDLDGTGPSGDATASTFAALESELVEHRGDWVEAAGDLDAETLQWAQERQDADSKLQAYRDRAAELRTRIRALELDREKAACPTCDRALGEHFKKLLSTLQSEWENVVQDGRWWKRRREQLDAKPENLRKLEEHALRLQARVEVAAEALERLRGTTAGRSGVAAGGIRPDSRELAPIGDQEWMRSGTARDVLRLIGSLLNQITEGLLVGVRLDEKLLVITVEGSVREPGGAEESALRLAVHLALWTHSRWKGPSVDSLLIWELHEEGSLGLLRGTLELLSDADRFPVPILLVAPPAAMDREPEALSQALEIRVDGQDRQEVRVSHVGPPAIHLSPGGVRGRQVS